MSAKNELSAAFVEGTVKETSKGFKINIHSLDDKQWDLIQDFRERPYDRYEVTVKRSGAGLVVMMALQSQA